MYLVLSVAALDAKTGEELWVYDPEVSGERGEGCCDVVSQVLRYTTVRSSSVL